MGVKPMELVGLVALTAAFGLIVAGAFMAAVIAGVFTLGGLLLLTGIGLLYLAAAREARARENGQHASGGNLRAAA
jgi:hypothetical protein